MSLLAVALAVVQSVVWQTAPAAPTVGDTIVIARLLPAGAGARARTRALDASERVEPLGPAEVLTATSGLLIRHRVALFAPGVHAVPMPAIELLHPDGSVEVVLGDTAFVRVEAVVPDTAQAPAPTPSQGPIGRPLRRPGRAALPVAAALVLLGGWLAWRLRSRRETPPDVPPTERSPDQPLMRWLAAGERRAVATIAVHRLRAAVAAQVPDAERAASPRDWAAAVAAARPEWPVDELGDIVRSLERARFAPLGADDLAELVDRADVVRGRLVPPAEGAA